MMNNKAIYVYLFIFLFTLVACSNVSLSDVTPTTMMSSATPANNQSKDSTPYDPSIQATLDFISEEREIGMQQGNEIVAAIENYYRETSQYPNHLDELVPVYLNEIPLTITGEQFEYRLVEPHFYSLSFLLRRRGERFACTYMGDLKTWECSGTGH
jgi:hypothetical protein